MAKKGKKGKHHPTAKAKAAYYKNVGKSFDRLAKVVSEHDPALYERVTNKY